MAFASWSAVTVSDTGTTIVDSAAGTVIVISTVISNPSNDDAQVVVSITTSADVDKFVFYLDLLAGDSPFAMDTRMVLADGDKLKVASDNSEVCVFVSGDQETT
jgi:methylglyoxal synthase